MHARINQDAPEAEALTHSFNSFSHSASGRNLRAAPMAIAVSARLIHFHGQFFAAITILLVRED